MPSHPAAKLGPLGHARGPTRGSTATYLRCSGDFNYIPSATLYMSVTTTPRPRVAKNKTFLSRKKKKKLAITSRLLALERQFVFVSQ